MLNGASFNRKRKQRKEFLCYEVCLGSAQITDVKKNAQLVRGVLWSCYVLGDLLHRTCVAINPKGVAECQMYQGIAVI